MLGSPVDHSRAIVAGESRTGRPERVSLVSDECRRYWQCHPDVDRRVGEHDDSNLRGLDVSMGVAYFQLSKTSSPANIATSMKPTSAGDQIAAELVAAMQSYRDPSHLTHLAIALHELEKTAFITELYRGLRASADAELRFVGLTGLLRANDLTALAEMADNLDLIPKVTTHDHVASAISARRDSSPDAIHSLGKIASSPNADLQRAAADALALTHTRDTLPFLAQLLDSPDHRTRELAILGLSRFVENLPITTPERVVYGRSLSPQGPAPYRTPDTDRHSLSKGWLASVNEAQYLQFWKSWWATMKGKLTTPVP
jgi:HEAT repeat protein